MEIHVKSLVFVDNEERFICSLRVWCARYLNHPKKALFDFEWQRMMAAKLQMNPELIRTVLKSLAKAYSLNKQYNESLNCYRELLREVVSLDIKTKLEIMSKIGPILQNISGVFTVCNFSHTLSWKGIIMSILLWQNKYLICLISVWH